MPVQRGEGVAWALLDAVVRFGALLYYNILVVAWPYVEGRLTGLNDRADYIGKAMSFLYLYQNGLPRRRSWKDWNQRGPDV
jgi:hypothetical protein